VADKDLSKKIGQRSKERSHLNKTENDSAIWGLKSSSVFPILDGTFRARSRGHSTSATELGKGGIALGERTFFKNTRSP
jgi:hypothetical protein